MQLITTKKFKSGSTIFHPGERVMVDDGRALIKNRLARKLSKVEARNILTEYVECARNLFTEEPVKINLEDKFTL